MIIVFLIMIGIFLLSLLTITFFARTCARTIWYESGLKEEWDKEHGTKLFSLK